MSDVKQHVNANTSILGRQYTMVVTKSKKFTRNVTKWQFTNTDNKNQ